MNTDKPIDTRGVFHKFSVARTDGGSLPGGEHEDCAYFVLDLDHDPHARAALAAYAYSARESRPQLADDILGIIGAENPGDGMRGALLTAMPRRPSDLDRILELAADLGIALDEADQRAPSGTHPPPSPSAWNWCSRCGQDVDDDMRTGEFRDGSEGTCLGCGTVYVAEAFTDGSWSFTERDTPTSRAQDLIREISPLVEQLRAAEKAVAKMRGEEVQLCLVRDAVRAVLQTGFGDESLLLQTVLGALGVAPYDPGAVKHGAGEWLVYIQREGGQAESTSVCFQHEENARDFFGRASDQWSDSYLCRIVAGPLDGHYEPRAPRAAVWPSDPAQARVVASWLLDQAHDMAVDRAGLVDEHGFDLVSAIEAMAMSAPATHDSACAHAVCGHGCIPGDPDNCDRPEDPCLCGAAIDPDHVPPDHPSHAFPTPEQVAAMPERDQPFAEGCGNCGCLPGDEEARLPCSPPGPVGTADQRDPRGLVEACAVALEESSRGDVSTFLRKGAALSVDVARDVLELMGPGVLALLPPELLLRCAGVVPPTPSMVAAMAGLDRTRGDLLRILAKRLAGSSCLGCAGQRAEDGGVPLARDARAPHTCGTSNEGWWP